MRISDWSSDVCSSDLELRLRGLELTLQRDDDGRWQVRGLPGDGKSSNDPFSAIEGLGELQVIGGKLRIEAPALGILAQLPRIDMRLRVDDERVRIGMHAWMQTDAAPLEARVRSEEHTSELQSLMRISYAVFCLK